MSRSKLKFKPEDFKNYKLNSKRIVDEPITREQWMLIKNMEPVIGEEFTGKNLQDAKNFIDEHIEAYKAILEEESYDYLRNQDPWLYD